MMPSIKLTTKQFSGHKCILKKVKDELKKECTSQSGNVDKKLYKKLMSQVQDYDSVELLDELVYLKNKY